MKKENRGGFGVLFAAISGAIMGAAAVVLSDPKKRKKVKGKVDSLIDKGKEKISIERKVKLG